MQIPWITIHVTDLNRSKHFYTDFLGLSVEREFSPSQNMTIVFFATDGGTKIELIRDTAHEAAAQTSSAVSIGFMPDDYAALLRSAREQGIVTVEPVKLGGNLECFFVNDPDGVGIQIIKG